MNDLDIVNTVFFRLIYDGSAWGDGVGNEALLFVASSTGLRRMRGNGEEF